jgi:hypothetical protein
MRNAMARVETAGNVAALALCWMAVAWLALWGRAHLAAIQWPQPSAWDVAGAVGRPVETCRRLADGCLGLSAIAAASAIALSAAEGTWWMSRRLARGRP